MDEKVWIGFDLSTQQLKSLAINEQLDIVFEANVHFDEDLPEFRFDQFRIISFNQIIFFQ